MCLDNELNYHISVILKYIEKWSTGLQALHTELPANIILGEERHINPAVCQRSGAQHKNHYIQVHSLQGVRLNRSFGVFSGGSLTFPALTHDCASIKPISESLHYPGLIQARPP